VLLAAGNGERMLGAQRGLKPLLELDGLLLIERAILSLAHAGIEHFRVVVGANADEIRRALRARERLAGIDITFVYCADAQLGNGHSLAAGAAGLDCSFILCMSDHVFDPRVAMRLQAQGTKDSERVHLATDAAVADVFDLDDATKVRVEGAAIRELGKNLKTFSRVDVGLFHCPGWMPRLALDAVAAGAHSVSDVMRQAIDHDAMRSCPIEPLFWQDVDTPEMLGEARRRLRAVGDFLQRGDDRFHRWLRRVGMVVGLGILAWVLARQPVGEIVAVMVPLGYSVLGLLAFPLLWYASNTAGLWVVVGGRVALPSLFLNRVAGDGLNSLLPLAGFGGEPFKARHLARWLPEQEAATFVIAARLIEELSGVVFAGGCLLICADALVWPGWLRTGSGLVGLALLVVGAAGTLLLSGGAPARLAATVMRLLGRPGSSPPRLALPRVLGALGFHVVGRLAGLLEVAFLLHLLGAGASAEAAAGVYAIVLLAGVATLVVPQGVGALEAASVFALGLLGQPPAVGVTFALLRRARMLTYGVIGSAVAYFTFRSAAGGSARNDGHGAADTGPTAAPQAARP
jgi:1L-myo-inositol 1-phosphate cytidylyltransferase